MRRNKWQLNQTLYILQLEAKEAREARLKSGSESPFKVTLRPTGINENGAVNKASSKSKFVNFRKMDRTNNNKTAKKSNSNKKDKGGKTVENGGCDKT